MSERTIIFSYQGEEKEVGQFANYEECKRAFQNEFSLSDEDMQKISLYYFDNENDQTMISSNEDYNIFLETGYTTIEGVMEEEKPDPMRSATVFKIKREEPEKEINLKNSIDSSIIDNSFNNSLENSANIIVKKTNSDGIDSANVNEMNNLNKIMELTFEDKKKENMIEECGAYDFATNLMNQYYDESIEIIKTVNWIKEEDKSILYGFVQYLKGRKI